MAKPRSWNGVSNEEIAMSIGSMKADLFGLKCEYKFAKKIESPHRMRAIRRDIARAFTEVQARRVADARATSDQV